MDRIFIFKYNNYYNRILKKFDTLEEYLPFELYQADGTPGEFIVNFEPGDGIETSQKILWDGPIPDYFIVSDPATFEITSRWFVLEAFRIRKGEFRLTLYRDVLADHYDIFTEAPCFIEKATLPDTSPLIFNREDFEVNQIKTSETLLKDKSDCAWLVGYLSNEQSISDITISNSEDINTEYIGELAAWDFYPYTNLATNTEKYKNSFKTNELSIGFHNKYSGKYYLTRLNLKTGTLETRDSGVSQAGTCVEYSSNTYSGNFIKDYCSRIYSELTFDVLKNRFLPDYISDITELSGKVLKDSNNKVYNVGVNPLSATNESYGDVGTATDMGILLNQIATEMSGITNVKVNPRYTVAFNRYNLTLEEQKTYSTSFNLDIAKYRTNDIYRIICIPYPDEGKTFQITGVMGEDGETEIGTIRITKEVAKNIAVSIMRKGGGTGTSTLVYDFQLLPYCPIQNNVMWDNVGEGNFIRLEGDSPILRGYTPVGRIGIVFEVKEPSFTFNIQHEIKIKDVKVENQCDSYRLCSPNYNSIFEFNAAKNGGVNYFNVDCHYKPYQPYIHINPDFNGLYGEDFNDPRGLILSGDFSLSSKSDPFVNYELNNKNYQLMFDRQIDNLEVQQKYQRISDIAGAIGGTITGGASGAFATAMFGAGKKGIGIGAGITGLLAGAGGIADVLFGDRLRSETLDYTKDMFGYRLDNIKAQPSSLTKVSAFNNNNKIYPVLEFYTCTETEREAFKNKLKYNGMSVGIIDKISNYILSEPSYIKGQLIRLENITDDFHVVNEIYKEVYKGVFV